MIGDDITVTVLNIGSGQARLGINAPRGVSVYREEIYEKIKKEQLREAATNQADLKG